MDRGMIPKAANPACLSREKQLGHNWGNWGGEGALPQSTPKGVMTGARILPTEAGRASDRGGVAAAYPNPNPPTRRYSGQVG